MTHLMLDDISQAEAILLTLRTEAVSPETCQAAMVVHSWHSRMLDFLCGGKSSCKSSQAGATVCRLPCTESCPAELCPGHKIGQPDWHPLWCA